MLGNSPDRSGAAVVAVVVFSALVLAAGCARNIKQDSKSGPDAKYKGAKAITLEGNEGEASGIVTYPGGDRVDWKLVTLPEGKKGNLEIELSWKPPRPGLDLAFDVYNEYGRKLGSVKPKKAGATKKSKSKRGKKSTTIADATGKVYIEVYASNRGDAGKYKLSVKFSENAGMLAAAFDPSKVTIPEPPKLASVPPPCDPAAIDPKNPECKGVYPPCDQNKPDKNNPNCSGVWPPCDPNAKDPNNPNCLSQYPECDRAAPDPANPKCKGVTKEPPKPISGAIVATETSSGGTIIHINRGSAHKVTTSWRGEVVDGSGRPIPKGDFQVYKVQEKKSFAKVKAAKAAVDDNLQVKLYPPE